MAAGYTSIPTVAGAILGIGALIYPSLSSALRAFVYGAHQGTSYKTGAVQAVL